MAKFSRFYSIFPMVLALAAPMALSTAVQAQASNSDQPLVVVRFNQPNVYYAKQMHDAISKAVEVKPSVTFEVVSCAPVTDIAEHDAKWQGIAGRHTKQVIDVMMQMGVPSERISVRGETRNGIQYDETRVYVH